MGYLGARGKWEGGKNIRQELGEALTRAPGGTSSSAACAAPGDWANAASATTGSEWTGVPDASEHFADFEATCGIYVPSRLGGAQGQQERTDWSTAADTATARISSQTSRREVLATWPMGPLKEGEAYWPTEESPENWDGGHRRILSRKTKLCIYDKQGTCSRGATCNYAHGDGDIRIRNKRALAKTTNCKTRLSGHCSSSSDECVFAHGDHFVQVHGQAGAAGASKVVSGYGCYVLGVLFGDDLLSERISSEVEPGSYDARADMVATRGMPPWPTQLAARPRTYLSGTFSF